MKSECHCSILKLLYGQVRDVTAWGTDCREQERWLFPSGGQRCRESEQAQTAERGEARMLGNGKRKVIGDSEVEERRGDSSQGRGNKEDKA